MRQPEAAASRIAPTLLVVEDESVVALDLDGQLRDMGYRVCGCVDNGRDAIDRARADRPDLILMDIVLKGDIDGIAAAARIGEELHIPVLFLTAYSDDDTVERAANAWPYGYLTKPFQGRELRAGIEVALRKAEVERRLRDSERWLAAVLRGVGDAVIATDAAGRVGLVNPAAERLLGMPSVQGRVAAEVVRLRDPDRDAALPLAPDATRAAGGDVPASRAALLVAADGSLVPVDDTVGTIDDEAGRLCGLAIVLHDVRERAAAQERLARSEHRFRGAFDNAPLGLALIDRSNRFVRVNRALCRLLDADPAQLFVVAGATLVARRRRLLPLHLAAVAWGFGIEATGAACLLTGLENRLRMLAGAAGYAGGFVDHYLVGLVYPAGLTRELQWLLAGAVLALNAVLYLRIARGERSCRH